VVGSGTQHFRIGIPRILDTYGTAVTSNQESYASL